ncbi:amidohydrolase family protein [Conexibacter sp. CPCC 206217]|uniref:amidohydrolase family protein n=1 Tax=Conexibacter sp. CPCC 206217 TaxID=3064574 RepID=UPI00271FEC48|nr:amidohydrolase family protein [Conexibacter sp. CPCC 206217]MDO8210222.1 amidohydrolase family protein [Conexibacter sp. CPCC 206217]
MRGKLLLRGGTVLTMVRGDEPRVADVLVEDGRIAAIGTALHADAELIDVSDHIVMPGFVDAHRHAWQTQLRGITHSWGLKDYIRSVRMRCGPQYTPEDMEIGNRAGMLEALAAGVTTVLDYCHNLPTRDHAEAALDGTFAAGIRSTFAFGLTGNYGVGTSFELDDRVAYVEELRARRFSCSRGLVQLGLNASDLAAEGPERLIREVEIARELELPITLHALSYNLPGMRAPGARTEVDVLRDAGLCGADMVWVHMSLATQGECDHVVSSGGAIASTPEAEIQMGMGRPVVARTLAAGGEPCLGVDVTANNSGCLFSQMRIALQVERMIANDPILERGEAPDAISPSTEQIVRAATVGGAKAMGLDHEIGTLEVGKQADVITLDGGDVNLLPVNDVLGAVALHAHPGNVSNVLVAGTVRKRAGRLVDDLADVRRRVRDSNARIFAELERTGGLIAQPPVDLGF